ncbi:hypothetical protein HUW51_17115 [Adhaeribacter swui]|uniref:Uncharacterized protein n=1 Tax=Adhaeribacter swui TaxID=2086471 RepID=A0A7G7GB25_9BACT|nr:hypothetical protein [Adhaeribacter swui]QNF34359.1 hypothetical protein HUW51_17115 [Adhaeribacter swui]
MRQSQNPDAHPGVHYRALAIATLSKIGYMTGPEIKKPQRGALRRFSLAISLSIKNNPWHFEVYNIYLTQIHNRVFKPDKYVFILAVLN